MTPAVACDRVTKRYADGTLALADVTLEVEPGTSVALVGGNGAGKSTLMHLVLGLLRPTAGTIRVLGQHDPAGAHPRVGYLPESPRPEPGLDARRWLRHMARLAGLAGGGEAAGRLGLERLGVARAADRLLLPEAAQAAVLAALLEAGIAIVALNPLRRTLEEAYLEVVR